MEEDEQENKMEKLNCGEDDTRLLLMMNNNGGGERHVGEGW